MVFWNYHPEEFVLQTILQADGNDLLAMLLTIT